MKEQFAKDVMKLSIQNSLLNEEDSFMNESLQKLAAENKVPVKISGIMASVFSMIFNLGKTKNLEAHNG